MRYMCIRLKNQQFRCSFDLWTRLIFLDVRSLVLERQPGADTAGYAGLEDRVDNHLGSILRAAGLSTLLAVGAELSLDEKDRLATALRDGALDTINEAGQRIVQRQLEVLPTLTIRPGFPVRVIVTRDLVFAPLGG
ncbi:conjugative transfer protein TrbI [Rhodovulum steppense]|uniref:Conjugative transfer protein TrbI n=1 Tax=Rhodovulum steppense TaxID=540251 RepID=A0A4R1YLS2_9RHOB|nr:conjugative transfer protein TrbI [Rhodovulum steppense]